MQKLAENVEKLLIYGCIDPSGMIAPLSDLTCSSCSLAIMAPYSGYYRWQKIYTLPVCGYLYDVVDSNKYIYHLRLPEFDPKRQGYFVDNKGIVTRQLE